MEWATLQYSRARVESAGDELVNPHTRPALLEETLQVINNWRACHYYPLNVFQNGLRSKARQVDPHVLIAQRIKRLYSIKLYLNP